jgi:hypothetical protein
MSRMHIVFLILRESSPEDPLQTGGARAADQWRVSNCLESQVGVSAREV